MNTAQNIQSSPATAAGFDIDKLDSVDTSEITFNVDLIVDEEGNGVSGVVCVGKNSPQYLGATDEIRINNIKRSSKRVKAIDTSTDAGAQLVAKTIDENEFKIAMAITVGWYGFNSKGQPVPFDKAVVEKMLTKYPTWVQKITARLEADANFTKV